jgi:hypothetical protein
MTPTPTPNESVQNDATPRKRRRARVDPWLALTPPRPTRPGEIAGIVLGDVVPVFGILLFGWSAAQYLVLGVFQVAFAAISVGVIGVSVTRRKQDGPFASPLRALVFGVQALVGDVIGSLVLTALFGWVIAVMAHQAEASLFDRSLLYGAAGVVLAAIPDMLRRFRADLHSPLGDAERQQRDQARFGALFLTGIVIFIAAGVFAGRNIGWGLVPLAIAITGLLLFRDLRPDLVHAWARPKDMPPS